MLKSWLGGESIYGGLGITLGLIFWTFPHALMILTTSLSTSDARLYEAARALKHPHQTFLCHATGSQVWVDQRLDRCVYLGGV